MRYWITTDTHLGHDRLVEHNQRPPNFSEIILNHLSGSLYKDDILIHLGDIYFENSYIWYDAIKNLNGKHILVRGNHDKNTNTWYLNHGFDFVCESFNLRFMGLNILFSHIPQKDIGYDINIHGHFHNTKFREHEPEIAEILTNKHYLLALEYNNYMPWNLEKVIKNFKYGRYKRIDEE